MTGIRSAFAPLLRLAVVLPLAISCADGVARVGPAHLRATIDLSIGDSVGEARDAYIFGDVRGLAFDDQGKLYVADSPANVVRVFDAKGAYRYTIGRRGRGPGDLLAPCCIAITSDGRLWIQETGNRRFSVFQPAGDSAGFLWSIRMPESAAREGDRLDFDGGKLVYVVRSALEEIGEWRTRRTLLDSAGRSTSEMVLREPPKDSLARFVYRDVSADGIVATASYEQPYGPTLLRTFGAGGESAEAVSSRYAVSWRDADGRLIARLQRNDVEGARLSERQREYAEEVIASVEARTKGAFPYGVPDRHPPITRIAFDLDGHLWIERSVRSGEPHEADVYDRSGRWLSIVQWPANVQLRYMVVRGDVALGIARDADGVQSVVRLRIAP